MQETVSPRLWPGTFSLFWKKFNKNEGEYGNHRLQKCTVVLVETADRSVYDEERIMKQLFPDVAMRRNFIPYEWNKIIFAGKILAGQSYRKGEGHEFCRETSRFTKRKGTFAESPCGKAEG